MSLMLVWMLLHTLASDAEEKTVIQLSRDGWPSKQTEAPRHLAEGESYWTWSDRCAPRRNDSECAAGRTLEIRVLDAKRRPVADAGVHWGTAEMLEEIPDAMLPFTRTDAKGSVQILAPPEARVFARAVSPVAASAWVAVSKPRTTINAGEGAAVSMRVAPAAGARLLLRAVDERGPMFRGAGNGIVEIPPVPRAAFLEATAWSDEGAPLSLVRRASQLPAAIELPSGFTLRGTAVSDDGAPVETASLDATFLIRSDAYAKSVTTDRAGTFTVRGLAGEVEWHLSKAALADAGSIVRLTSDLDLGKIVLPRARRIRVHIAGREGKPLEGAEVSAAVAPVAHTDASGDALLRGVPPGEIEATIRARGYLSRTVRLGAEERAVVTLEPAAAVHAVVVHASDGTPAGPGSVAVELDGAKTLADFGADGVIEIDDLDAGTLTLEIRGATGAPFRVPPRVVQSGETIDLGRIELQPGFAIRGRTVDADSGAELAGVRVRVLRPSTFAPSLSYARSDWIESESGADGTFVAGGLAPGIYWLWTESSGRAPVVRHGIEIDGGSGEIDAGDLLVPRGRTIDVTCRPAARCGTEVRAIIASADWLPISAAFQEGNARLAPVPSGVIALRLLDHSAVVHEREVTVREDDNAIDIDLRGTRVAGLVTRAGKPVSGGRVLFANGSGSAPRFVQVTQMRRTGMMGSDIIGTVPRVLSAGVSENGAFELEDVAPGIYMATWSSEAGRAPAQRVVIPESKRATVRIDLAGGGVEGAVKLADGRTPAESVVSIEQHGIVTTLPVQSDGAFVFAGLGPGTVTLRARAGHARIERTAEIEADRMSRVDLVLEPEDTRTLAVLVRSGSMPVPNAMVFLRQTGATRAAMTASDGRATFALGSDAPMMLAAYVPSMGWTFIPPQAADSSEVALELQRSSGGIAASAGKESLAVSVRAPTGFPLSEALMILGVPNIVRPGSPLVIYGAPAGRYEVVGRGMARNVVVSDGVAELKF